MFKRSFWAIAPLVLLMACGKEDLGTRRITNAVTGSKDPVTATTATTSATASTSTTATSIDYYLNGMYYGPITSQIGKEKGHAPITYIDEIKYSFTNSLLTYAAHNIPLVEMHDEGLDISSVVAKQARGTVACGIGTVSTASQAATDCYNKTEISWSGKDSAVNGEGEWVLIVRTETGKEVWLDRRTGLVWSDVLVTAGNWCQASGNQQISNGVDCATLAHEKFCQDKLFLDSKGNLDDKIIDWRLPTRNDYLQADINGLRFVVPNANQAFWTATLNSANRTEAWTYHGGTGVLSSLNRSQTKAIRCVGRPIKI